MADRASQHLQKMNSASKRGTPIPIRSKYMSLHDMINERGDEYPSVSALDSYDCSNRFHEVDMIKDYNKMYRVKAPLRLVPAGAGDRSCHWRPNALCIYKDAIVAGLRFPFHEFIPRLLADVQINPCQLPPNAWRIINCFMVLCLRKTFLYNNPKWKNEFMYLVWEGGDWGTLFRRSFGRVSDGSPSNIVLNEEESHAYSELIKDNGTTVAWELLDEFVLKSVGLSTVHDKAAAFINKTNEPKDVETSRMKRARLGDDRRGKPSVPRFLIPAEIPGDEADIPVSSKSSVWRPNWGIRKKDTITGVSKHVVDWSYHSLTPCDYKDFVADSTLEGVEHLGAQAIAATNANFQGALFQAKAWRTSSEANRVKLERFEEEVKSLKETLARRENELADAQADIVELRKSKDDCIDEYLDSQEYKDLIEKHDEILFPVQHTSGWEDVVQAILAKHPGVFDAADFPAPHPPTPLERILAGVDDMEEDARILDPGHSSPLGDTSADDADEHSSGSSSGEETNAGVKEGEA
ncbi:hypothetical protein POM88_006932 [Heracleum sosnowskyi]|uniref:Transposase (putative) gypsy type domain-containing protein n=1 Tax=Heracleum sosnowskyi TaxID=360622 RepID=A0AAD8N561_9APIA|nr:hypothetical protein POM88_006932 [Heracleum sosnowskyi]